jgi:hypothetical protein
MARNCQTNRQSEAPPNERLQRTRPLLRMLLNPNGSGWGLAAEAPRSPLYTSLIRGYELSLSA